MHQEEAYTDTRLTLSCDKALEINGDRYPHGLAIFLRPETPNTDSHRLGARLWCQTCKEKRLLCEVVGLPALALICGEPGDKKWKQKQFSHRTMNTMPSVAKIIQNICSALDSLDLSFTLSLHSHNEPTGVQNAVVVRTPQCRPPVITPVRRDKYVWVLRRWQRVTHSSWRGEDTSLNQQYIRNEIDLIRANRRCLKLKLYTYHER